jgi:uncharacterized glyoxalase superfamily protein PhnB
VIRNRSVPAATVIPELGYRDVLEAAEWLCRAFGFTERLRIDGHRVQLTLGDGAIVATELGPAASPERGASGAGTHGLLVRVEDVDGHYELARHAGAHVIHPPADYGFGERQYTVEDLGGHVWTFSQSIADVDPETWGGVAVNLD